MNKRNGNILIGALAFGVLVYLLLSGRAVLTTKGYLVLFVLCPLGLLMAFLERRKGRKREAGGEGAASTEKAEFRKTGEKAERTDNAAEGGGSILIELPFVMRLAILFLLVVCWGLVLMASWLMSLDGAFEKDPSAVTSFAAVWGLLIVLTVFAVIIWVMVRMEIQYTAEGFTVKRFLRKKAYTWQDIGEVKSQGEIISFYDGSGKRLFRAGQSYPGVAGFRKLYQSR